ncbi:hypothetical protein BDR26DRAFT_501658 [Obelidium mucronatum]|nr:hypothetical protein BDR26DRAFT_501658 [Obelidium mucronatum]
MNRQMMTETLISSPELHIDPGMHCAAREFAQRRFTELVSIVEESTQLAAVFQNNASSSSDSSEHYSIDISLEVKWLGLVVKVLSGFEMLDTTAISPYDLDQEGDGAPLGPIGISESVRGSLFVRGDNSSLDCRDVVIKKFIPSPKRNLRRLFCENSALWLSASNDKRILPIIGTCFQTAPQLTHYTIHAKWKYILLLTTASWSTLCDSYMKPHQQCHYFMEWALFTGSFAKLECVGR